MKALEKKYLRTIVFGIYDSGSGPKKLLECYTFKVSYPSLNEIEVSMNGDRLTPDSIRGQAIMMVRTLVTMCSTLDPLPQDRFLTMKLYYYEDITPLGWQPKFFIDATGEDDDIRFKESEPLRISLGKINTPYHSLCVKLRTQEDSIQQECKSGSVAGDNDSENLIAFSDENVCSNDKFDPNEEETEIPEEALCATSTLDRVKEHLLRVRRISVKFVSQELDLPLGEVRDAFKKLCDMNILSQRYELVSQDQPLIQPVSEDVSSESKAGSKISFVQRQLYRAIVKIYSDRVQCVTNDALMRILDISVAEASEIGRLLQDSNFLTAPAGRCGRYVIYNQDTAKMHATARDALNNLMKSAPGYAELKAAESLSRDGQGKEVQCKSSINHKDERSELTDAGEKARTFRVTSVGSSPSTACLKEKGTPHTPSNSIPASVMGNRRRVYGLGDKPDGSPVIQRSEKSSVGFEFADKQSLGDSGHTSETENKKRLRSQETVESEPFSLSQNTMLDFDNSRRSSKLKKPLYQYGRTQKKRRVQLNDIF